MKIDDLKQFIIVANSPKLSYAANELNVSQSSISRLIQRMEDELNVELFNRTPNGIVLNDAGYYVLNQAKELIQNVDNLNAIISSYKKKDEPIIVGSNFTGALRFFSLSYNAKTINGSLATGIQMNNNELEPALLNGSIDIALSYESINHFDIECTFWGNLPLKVYVHKESHLYGNNVIFLSDLYNMMVVFRNDSDRIRSIIESMNLPLKYIFCNDPVIAKSILENPNIYVFATFEPFVHCRERKLIPIRSKVLSTDLYLAYLKKNTQRVKNLIELAEQLKPLLTDSALFD